MSSIRSHSFFPSIALFFLLPLLVSCSASKQSRYLSDESFDQGRLSNETVELNASAGPFAVANAQVITDNDSSFEQKLEIIKGAEKTLDIAYYIFSSDYSSSVLSQALVDAAKRGVRVRMLLDYHSNYQLLDMFLMMEQKGNSGEGSLEVRFYNRPTEVLIRDAVYLTMGCGEVGMPGQTRGCAEKKFAEIDTRFKNLVGKDLEETQSRVLNYNSGGSGLFLSGLYAKDIDLLAFSVIKGQDIDFSALTGDKKKEEASEIENPSDALSSAIKAGTVYWKSRAANEKKLERLVANIKLNLAFMFFGRKINPLYDTLTAYLPIGKRDDAKEAFRDWAYLTDFLHHKFLLADGRMLQLGGRNIEDSYHMAPNSLVLRYLFMDTDVYLELAQADNKLSGSFERLWNFKEMIASLSEVRQHAPNDFHAATKSAEKACLDLDPQKKSGEYQRCYDKEFSEKLNLDNRMAIADKDMQENAEIFRNKYRALPQDQRSKSFDIDGSAEVFYVENLPFERTESGEKQVRTFGALNHQEGESGKYIHSLWRAALRNACHVATAENPQHVILHNAYFFLPSNLLADLGRMVDGGIDCSNVRISVLTNSMGTTDLNIINVAAAYSLKALARYYAENRDPKRGAEFYYYEYLRQGSDKDKSSVSLHSKVNIFGPDMFIGSANADVRSYMMDTNNGFFIRNAPQLHADYLSWFESILADETRVVDRTEHFRTTTREKLHKKHREFFSTRLAQLVSKDAKVPVALLDWLEEVLDTIYDLSAATLKQKGKPTGAKRDLNEYFKLL